MSHAMTDIPEDVLKLAREVWSACIKADLGWSKSNPAEVIARAIMADRAAQAERMARLEDAVNFVARWAWRTDPPNAFGKLSDSDRLSCIKHHPTIKKAAQPHIELAEAEASQEGSEPS